MTEYRVNVDAYNGPLDLLLYLLRRDEIDIYDIPVARITEQYIHFVTLLSSLDPNIAGDFLVMLATLLEIKSRAMLPKAPDIEEQDDLEDPRLELVRQLLAYKTYKDAAHQLGTAAEVQALRYPRQPSEIPSEPGEMDIEDMSVWTLMQAFNRLLEQTGKTVKPHEVVVDDTPLALHAADVIDSLQREGGSQVFETIFAGRTKAEMIGLFLALLELIRRRRIRVTQDRHFGPIVIHLLDATPIDAFLDETEDAEPPIVNPGDAESIGPVETDAVEHDQAGGMEDPTAATQDESDETDYSTDESELESDVIDDPVSDHELDRIEAELRE